MQITYIWDKFHLRRHKVILLLALIFCMLTAEAQQKRWVQRNNPNYDDKKLTYGFLIALHSSIYQINYSDQFITQAFDTAALGQFFLDFRVFPGIYCELSP